MDFRVVWSAAALADLRDLVRYIARDDRVVAKRFGDLIVTKIDALVKFPRIGRRVPEFAEENLRQIVVSSYRVVYEIDDSMGNISVLRVWHGARDALDELSLKPGNGSSRS
ncbi:type II toxin-antitoxin system RelE/ParE family toxin [Haloferula sp. BvORR071]|uniref:type II toxin-antitoxin system RelE/ParE family toxin n=1 Tax=Haloferula sp. BvORR071 TaxID=1396141 RepID=UPI00094642AA|nr:type II toxin-antitoxin system RelE/ParE family toxin [Haloferula sp. BvORR071]